MRVLMLQWDASPGLHGTVRDKVNTIILINHRDGGIGVYAGIGGNG